MSDQFKSGFRPPPDGDHTGDQIGRLLRLAGPREAVPADRMGRRELRSRAEWRQQDACAFPEDASAGRWARCRSGARAARRPPGRRRRPCRAGPTTDLATIEVLSGAARSDVSPRTAQSRPLFQIGDRIREGDGVDTTSGGLVALRLAAEPRCEWTAEPGCDCCQTPRLALDEGTIYIDSGVTQRLAPRDPYSRGRRARRRHPIRSALQRLGAPSAGS